MLGDIYKVKSDTLILNFSSKILITSVYSIQYVTHKVKNYYFLYYLYKINEVGGFIPYLQKRWLPIVVIMGRLKIHLLVDFWGL